MVSTLIKIDKYLYRNMLRASCRYWNLSQIAFFGTLCWRTLLCYLADFIRCTIGHRDTGNRFLQIFNVYYQALCSSLYIAKINVVIFTTYTNLK